jgi:hypothetical protein
VLERALGMRVGLDETVAAIERQLDRIEGQSGDAPSGNREPPPTGARSRRR